MYPSIPITALMSEFGLTSVHILPDFWQRIYVCHLLGFPDCIPTKNVLLITLQVGNGKAQPEN